ncbi:MAG TPA: MerR family transcriptional regulator [Thermodesulfobacteriota bacterium]|nr:MerR family transcriptional regulator [Thermodesulfobacteriota bacterium]
MDKPLKISRASQLTGLSRHTLRYYEKIGLIDPVKRAEDGHRYYTENDISWIEFLNRLRITGMPISQMKIFADLRRRGASTTRERREMLEDFKNDLYERLTDLNRHLVAIEQKVKQYRELEKKRTKRRQ